MNPQELRKWAIQLVFNDSDKGGDINSSINEAELIVKFILSDEPNKYKIPSLGVAIGGHPTELKLD